MPVNYMTAIAATVETNSNTITITGESVDFSKIDENYVVLLDNGLYVMPVVSGTVFDANGDSTLTLVEPWLGAALNHKKLLVIPVFAKIYESVAAMTALNEVTRGILLKLESLLSATTPTLEIAVGSTATIQTVPYGFVLAQVTALIDQLNSLVGSVLAPSKAAFFALAEQRKRESAGSGFAEWGNHVHEKTSAYYDHINEGLYVRSPQFLDGDYTNSLLFGRQGSLGEGVSLTESPLVNVNGYEISVYDVLNLSSNNFIKLPSAPDGLDKSDGTRYIDLAAAIIDGGTSLSHSVLSRQDFVFLEVWHEKISEKDIVVPLGNVQYGGTSLYGIGMNPLSTYGVPQGYSAFGHWDTNTEGRGRQWSTIDAASKTLFIQDHQNNIYSDNGELIQVRYRIRVVKGLGDDWDIDFNKNLYQDEGNLQYVHAQGKLSTISKEIGDRTSGNSGVFAVYNNGFNNTGIGAWAAVNQSYNSTDASLAQDGLCFAVPIALVQRRNQGAYHPSYNPEGSATFDTGSGRFLWAHVSVNATDKSYCFTHVGGAFSGSLGSNNKGRADGKFYDGIYASDIQDLRMSAKKLPLSEIREKAKRKAIAGEIRGVESASFTEVSTVTAISAGQWTNDNNWAVGGRYTHRATKSLTSGLWRDLPGEVDITERHIFVHAVSSTGEIVKAQVFMIKPTLGAGAFQTVVSNPFSAFCTDLGTNLVLSRQQTSKSAKPTWTDIIGSPANIAASFPDGVEGQWIPQIPDGTCQNFKFNRKVLSRLQSLSSDNNGDAWNASTFGSSVDNGSSLNSHTSSPPSGQIYLVHYETQAHFTEDAVNSEVLHLGDITMTNGRYIEQGGLMTSNLIGKVSTYPYGDGSNVTIPMEDHRIRDNKLDSWLGVHHKNLMVNNSQSAAVKYLTYLSHDDGQLTLNFAYKEMVWDIALDTGNEFVDIAGTTVADSLTVGLHYNITTGAFAGYYLCIAANITVSALDSITNLYLDQEGNIHAQSGELLLKRWDGNGFGDNNQFEIADNQNTLTDDNGNPVFYGTARVGLPYFYVGE